MAIIVCPLSRVAEIVRTRTPSHVVSLLNPGTPFPRIDGYDASSHLCLEVHDINVEMEGQDAVCGLRIARILEFVRSWQRDAPILIHCYAGISRSTATAFIAACAQNPHSDETAIARAIRAASPTATPNRRFVALADAALQREGRMNRAVEAIGVGAPQWPAIAEAQPFAIESRFA